MKRFQLAVRPLILSLFLIFSAGCRPPSAGPAEAAAIQISTVEALLENIGPGANLQLEPGYYNLSTYVQQLQQAGTLEDWNLAHPHVQLQPVVDGVQVEICNADGLTIAGASPYRADAHLVIEPRYGNVLTFCDCSGLLLENLTLGHTETGTCIGDVLSFYGDCSGRLRNLDLYGCGVWGISIFDGAVSLSLSDTLIRDCYSGPYFISAVQSGKIAFSDCQFIGSQRAGFINWDICGCDVEFTSCAFGAGESAARLDRLANYQNCVWTP